MKKWIFTGIAVLLTLALMMAACDFAPLSLVEKGINENKEEFAQYSADGKTLTINLEGGSPSKNMSRALTNALARINHDFYEVVFYYDADGSGAGAPKVSRTSWSRGEGAALAVFRGKDGTVGINYGSVDFSSSIEGAVAAVDTGAAILFVGKKTSKGAVLLAVGTLVNTADNMGNYPGTPSTIVKSTTSKVTFDIASLSSGIFPDNLAGSSFYTIQDTTGGSFDFDNDADTITAITTNTPGDGTQFVAQIFKTVPFPLYMFTSEETTGSDRHYAGKFTFKTATTGGLVPDLPTPVGLHHISNYVKGIVTAAPASYEYTDLIGPNVLINGEKINGNADDLGVEVTMENNMTADATLNNEAYFIIKVPKGVGGLIAFNFNIPVYAITKANADNSVAPILWFVQSGIENNYIDNGVGLGGSILLGIGDPSLIKIDNAFKN
ncbi:MAG: hypothetical protein FWB86_00900 [Treponema sp.]|nr:hypothetical protein [Treponema sp.]MCL2250656.1 hypothetical protein [Treponema sp.]